MAQQMKNGSKHDGSRTITIRDTYDYAVVNDHNCGKHRNKTPHTKRAIHWAFRNYTLLPKSSLKHQQAHKLLRQLGLED